MPEISRTTAALRIFGDDLDPDEVSRLLGIEPTTGRRKGDVFQTPLGRTMIAQSGSWRLEAITASPGNLNVQISALLAKATDDLSVWLALSRRYECDVFCGLFMAGKNEGECLEPGTLTMLGRRGLKLDLDIYGSED